MNQFGISEIIQVSNHCFQLLNTIHHDKSSSPCTLYRKSFCHSDPSPDQESYNCSFKSYVHELSWISKDNLFLLDFDEIILDCHGWIYLDET